MHLTSDNASVNDATMHSLGTGLSTSGIEFNAVERRGR